MYRTNSCGELRLKDAGKEVTLAGWVQRVRKMGGMTFVDLRDRYGITQLVFNESSSKELTEKANKLGREFCIQIVGEVSERQSKNNNIPTGEIEILVSTLNILSESVTPPFTIEDNTDGGDDLRMKYRYLDLRRNPVRKNLELRHKMTILIRNFLDNLQFIEVETPLLIGSTPEGARDFVVPSRMNPGQFYALPQSPQTLKQLLMVSGFDRYFQIAECFRDEDLRADRQPEFTQIDLEMSFADSDDVISMQEGLLKRIMKELKGIDIDTPFPRLTYKEAMERYGSDKPDTRFDIELNKLNDIFEESDFMVFKDALETGGDIRGISIPGGAAEFSRKKIDKLTDEAKHYGAKGLLWIKVEEDGFSSSASKFLNDGELTKVAERCGSKPGDIIFIVSAQPKVVFDTLGWLRRKIAGILGLLDDNKFNFLWVVDFPMFEKDDEGNLKAMHHPFTQPKLDELDKLDGDILSLNADAYDIVLNGVELGGGSIRIHDRELQDKMFKVLGLGEEERMEKFGFFIEAFKYGAPPHAGLAYGLDRMVMLLLGESSIREVIAFPKNANAECPVSEAPGKADSVQLEELGLAVVTKHEQN